MRTPLFPKNDGPVTMKQGRVGDCYLLAVLDCLFNAGPEGYQAIKSLFTETSHGVTVRIKRSKQSVFLNPDMLVNKYEYYRDWENNDDVFFISNQRLDEIDSDNEDGVVTNSLAVKILERLTPYYYVSSWDARAVRSSIMAHDLQKRYEGTPTSFMGNFLNLRYHETKQLPDIIQLKTLYPHQPVYISMRYGKTDTHGKAHQYHALRIEDIVPQKHRKGKYDFVLVNPWDNQTREIHSSDELLKRKCSFCTYVTNLQEEEERLFLLSLPFHRALYISARPELLRSLMGQGRQSPTLHTVPFVQDMDGRKDVSLVHLKELLKQIKIFPISFDGIYSRKAIGMHISRLQTQIVGMIERSPFMVEHRRLQLSGWPVSVSQVYEYKMQSISMVAEVRQKELEIANTLTDACLQRILAFEVSFHSKNTHAEIEQHRLTLKRQLRSIIENDPDLTEAINVLGTPESIWRAIHNMEAKIDLEANLKINKILSKKEAQRIIEQSAFIESLSMLNTKARDFEIKAQSNKGYALLAQSTRTLYMNLIHAKDVFLSANMSLKLNLSELKYTCIAILNQSKPLLETQPWWKQLCDNIEKIFQTRVPVTLNTRGSSRWAMFTSSNGGAKLNEAQGDYQIRTLMGTGH